MPDVLPSRERAHLAIAAIRVLDHRMGKPPRPADIAQLLGWTVEETLAVARGLADAGIVQLHETPFEIRVNLRDHLKIESLPIEAEKAALRGEVDEFKRKSRQRKDEIDRLFGSAERDQKKRKELDDLEKDFQEFRRKSRRSQE
jgi:hypothetical protein